MSELTRPIRILSEIGLFRGLDAAALARVAAVARSVTVSPSAFFFREGAKADMLYVLERGRVKLMQTTPEGHAAVLRFIGPGEVFGPTAALQDRPYPVSAQAVCRCRAIGWNGRTMARLMEEQSRIALNALGELSDHLHHLRTRFWELATLRVEQRVARMLLRIGRLAGLETAGGVLIDVLLSRQELAEMTGTTLYTVSRILRGWQRAGLVQAGRQRVTIVALDRLQRIADDVTPFAQPRPSRARSRPVADQAPRPHLPCRR